MKNIRKSLVLIALILFGALSILSGCETNIYKNLKLSLTTSATNGVFKLKDRAEDNVFTVTAETTGMPKGYDGEVVFSLPVNDSVEIIENAKKLRDGVFYGSFLAKGPGTVNIKAVTLEGNVTSEITIKVVKEISAINFSDTLIPVVKGTETDIANFLTYAPLNTNQTEVELELIKQGANDELIKVVRNGSKITVPNNCDVTDFEVVAKSIHNERVFARANAKVISLVEASQLSIRHDAGTIDDTSDDRVLTSSRGEYFLDLASNTSDLHEKNIYVAFENPNDSVNYSVSVLGLTDDGMIVENGRKKGVVQIDVNKATGMLTVKAVGLGSDKIILNVTRRDFPNYTQFTRQLIINVNVSAYPTEIEVLGLNKDGALEVYANYDESMFGAMLKFNVKNEFGIMSGEDVYLLLSGYDDKVFLFDKFRTQLQFKENDAFIKYNSNFEYYLKHSLSTSPNDLTLTITSAKYNKIVKTIKLAILTRPVNLTTDLNEKEGNLAIDINSPDPVVLGIKGLPNGFDYSRLTFAYNKDLVNVAVQSSKIIVSTKGSIGKTDIVITAPNGSYVKFITSLYESLDLESTTLTIAGRVIAPFELNESDPEQVTVGTNLVLPMLFKINGKDYSTLPEIFDFEATTSNKDAVRIDYSYKLVTQTRSGTSLITVKITGYNNAGVKNRTATFKINISSHAPLSGIMVASREVKIYDYREINAEQRQTFGTHKIILNTQPSYATYTFDDIDWLINFNGVTYSAKKSESVKFDAETNSYTLRTDNNTVITLITSSDNPTQAQVYCSLGSTSSATFTVTAEIKQSFVNELGILIDATKQIDIKIDVIKPVAVEYFVFDNIETKVIKNLYREYYVTFDERELSYTDAGYTTNNVRQIAFDVYPKNALYRDLDVRCSVPTSIDVSINNQTGMLTITAKNKILSEYGTALITVWSKDSVSSLGSVGSLYAEITVRILNGTENSPFEIKTASDLKKINFSMNAFFELADNIVIGAWSPIGYVNNNVIVPFTGKLSGTNKTRDAAGNVLEERQYYLSNLNITENYSHAGLFAMLGKTGVLENLIVSDINIRNTSLSYSSNYYIGTIAGYSEGRIKNVTISDLSGVDNFNGAYFNTLDKGEQTKGIYVFAPNGTTSTKNVFVGGVVGFVNNTSLVESVGRLNDAEENIGAFSTRNQQIDLMKVSDADEPQIKNANVSMELNINAKTLVAYVGGVVGFNNKAVITNDVSTQGFSDKDVVVCINSRVDDVQNSNSSFGGVAGFNNGQINNYNVKTMVPGKTGVTDSARKLSNVGGVVGYNAGTVEDNISTPLIRGNENVGGLVGVSENTVVNLSSAKYRFVNGINLENNSDLVEFTKNFNIEYVTYSNLMVRVRNDEYNNDEVTLTDILEQDLKVAVGIAPAVIDNFADHYLTVEYDAGKTVKKEHMVVLQVENKNVNIPLDPSKISYVYKQNNGGSNVRLVTTELSISEKTFSDIVSVQEIAETLKTAKVNYVTGNNVEFLETEQIAEYKTGVSGYDNVGGLIGTYAGLYYQAPRENDAINLDGNVLENNLVYAFKTPTTKPLTANQKLLFTNTLEYNSVYTYYNSTLINKWISDVDYNNDEYFGDILLEKDTNKKDVGGLIGESFNAFVQYNSVNAAVACYNANAGGLVGRVKQKMFNNSFNIESVIQIADCYFAGAILNFDPNLNSTNKDNPQRSISEYGLLIGNAAYAKQTGLNYGEWSDNDLSGGYNGYNEDTGYDGDTLIFYFAPYAISKANSKLYFNNIANTYFYGNFNCGAGNLIETPGAVSFVGSNSSTTIKHFKMLKTPLRGGANGPLEYASPSDLRYQEIFTDEPITNLSFNKKDYLYYTFSNGTTTTSKMGLFRVVDDSSDSGFDSGRIPLSVFDKPEVKIYETTLEVNSSTTNQFAADHVAQSFNVYKISQISDGLLNYRDENGIDDDDEVYGSSDFDAAVREKLKNYYWYNCADVNLGLPVLLSRLKVYNENIKLLVNFPPKAIEVSVKTNMVNVWGNKSSKDGLTSTIYYYSLSSSNYNANGSINFGVSNLLSGQVLSYTNQLNNELKNYNTYEITDVISYKTIPPFIGKGSFTITSSNSQVLSVERVNNELKLVAKGTGVVTLFISSAYNSKLTIPVTVNVVNAINKAELSYYTSGNKNVVNSGSEVVVSKSTQANTHNFILNSDLSGKLDFSFGRWAKTFELNKNTASGTRYYYVAEKSFNISGEDVNGYSVLHESALTDFNNITINGKSFKEERLEVKLSDTKNYKIYYVYYIDVPSGVTANIVGLNESNTKLLSMPYFVSINENNVSTVTTALTLTSKSIVEGVTYEYGYASDYVLINGVPVAGIYTPNNSNLQNSFDYSNYTNQINEYVRLFNVKVVNSSYNVNVSANTINFFVKQPISFYVDVKTDNPLALLYLTYQGNSNEERTIAVSKIVGGNLERAMESLTANGLTLRVMSIDKTSFENSDIAEKFIRYYFLLEVKDENKLNIQQIVNKAYNFFIVKNNVSVKYDTTETFVVSDLREITLSSSLVSVTLNPQEIVNISLKHYPKGEVTTKTASNGTQTTISELGEEAYENIIPGVTGVLKINISPMFANFDNIVLRSSTSQGSVVWFNQVIANMVLNKDGYHVYDGTYSTIPGAHDILGRITLSKTSNKFADGSTNFDGFVYVKTLINSFVNESGEFVLTAEAYKNGVIVKTQSLKLKVKTTPTLNLHVNGRDSAAVARGTSLTFSADHEGIEGEVDFSGSYVYRIVNGMESMLGGIGTYFTVSKNGNNYVLDTNVALNSSAYIKVVGKITKEINGETYVKTDALNVKVSDFVIDGISVGNVVNGNFVGLFNQTYGLIVRISQYTCHPSLEQIVATQVKDLERQFSSVNNSLSSSGAWYSGNEQKHETIKKGTNAANTFVFSSMANVEFNNETIYTIRNIRFNSGDRLLARAVYCYTEDGIKPITNNDDYSLLQNDPFTYDRYFEFGFGFYRVRNEEKPDPIATVEEFKKMQDGVDYILVSDLELTDWEPLNVNINSLDGNGYVITIKNFKLDAQTETENGSVAGDKTFGIFTQINSGTIIKNLIVEVKPNPEMGINYETADKTAVNGDLNIDATAYKNVTFGLLAGINYGIITNVQVTFDATLLKIEREVIIARASADNPDYKDYWDNNKFDEHKFVQELIDTQFKNSYVTIETTTSSDMTEEYRYNYNYIIESSDGTSKIIFVRKNRSRDLSVIKVNTSISTDSQEHYMGILVGKNEVGSGDSGSQMGYISNSSVENITLNGIGYVAGFAAYNAGKISSSYFKGANIINRSGESDSKNSATGGFVVFNRGANASIQYCYVEGRLGDGDGFTLSADGTFKTNSSNADKTGLTESIKKDFAGYSYNEKKDRNYNTASLRAMNSAISSATESSAFIYENDGVISNSYANILVKSSLKTSGFVFKNQAAGTIDACFSLSSVLVNDMNTSPFVGKNAQYAYNNVTPNSITHCHYLKLGSQETDSALEVANKDVFIDEGELATGIGAGYFDEYNTFQSFAFNTDFTLNSQKEVTRAVWFIPSRGTEVIYPKNFKNNFYSLARPQLVAANLKTQSIRVWAGSETSSENNYTFVSAVAGESISNPILIKSAEAFNDYLNYDSSISDADRNFAIRLVSDIAFNNKDSLTAKTYTMEYYGDLDGNGMKISDLRLIADKNFETQNKTGVTHLGLFGKIKTKDKGYSTEQRGVVRNLNIDVAEVKGSDVTYVGALAGEIQNANVFNVNITGADVIQGRNVVGGLAGLITGDSEIVNITSSLSVKAAYYKNPNVFKATNSLFAPSAYGTFEIYVPQKENSKKEIVEAAVIKNDKTISYAGGIVGIFDVNPRPADEQNKRSLFNAKARSLKVFGNVSLVGEIVGGVFGAIGADSTTSEINFIVSDNQQPELIASRVAGGVVGENRGSLERALISQTLESQKKIDNEYKASAINTGYKVINKGYNNLFSGNPHYIGGMVGFNNGGNIINAYAKVNTININSMYAGGLVGLNMGGKINYAYTTASVKAFRAVGGIIGLQTGKLLIDNESKAIDPTKDKILNLLFIDNILDLEVANSVLSKECSVISNLVAANIWREDDVYTDRSVNYNGSSLDIGTIVGKILTNAKKQYKTSDVFEYLPSVGERKNGGESIFFVQPMLNCALGTTVGTIKELSNDEIEKKTINLMPEIGVIDNDSGKGEGVIEGDVREIRAIDSTSYNYAGVSGTSTQSDTAENTSTNKQYLYSRVQNIGSARTLQEIFATKLNVNEASVWGDKSTTIGTTAEEKEIFDNWSSDYWTGVKKETVADVKTALPYLEPKAIKSRILVYKADDLKQMNTYKTAEFILQNDIDIHAENEADMWIPVGTLADPFMGSIHSASKSDGGYYNFKIYDSAPDAKKGTIKQNGDFAGLLGVVDDASFHHFTISNVKIVSSGAYAGSLFAYAKNKVKVNQVAFNAVDISGIASTAGVAVGYAENITILNTLVNNSTLTITGFKADNNTKETLYGFGGLVGKFKNEEKNVIAANSINVQGVTITITSSTGAKEPGSSLDVGGVFGGINPDIKTATQTGIAGINAKKVQITATITNGANFDSISIGGLIGKSNKATLTSLRTESEVEAAPAALSDEVQRQTETYILGNSISKASTIEATISNFANNVYVGGAVGVIEGEINTPGLENINAQLDHITVTNSANTNSVDSNTVVGGVVGKVSNYDVKGLECTLRDTTSTNMVTIPNGSVSKTSVGGLIGIVSNSFSVTNAVVTAENAIVVSVGSANETVLTSVGGAFGLVDLGYYVGPIEAKNGEISRVVANVELLKGETTIANPSTFNIGGLVGTIYNGNITQCVSNSNVSKTGVVSGDRFNLGGLVGLADIDNKNKLFKTDEDKYFSNITIKNNYSTGFVESGYASGISQSNLGLIVGSLNYKYAIRNSALHASAFEMLNNYSIGFFKGTNTDVFASTNKGGVLGGITTSSGSTPEDKKTTLTQDTKDPNGFNKYKNATNIKLIENYYNRDFVPYSNNFGAALNTESMLFKSFSHFSGAALSAWDTNVWSIENNSYPLLAWIKNSGEAKLDKSKTITGVSFVLDGTLLGEIEDSKLLMSPDTNDETYSNLINYNANGTSYNTLQSAGVKANPAKAYDEKAKSVIFSSNYDKGNISNKVYYFNNNAGLDNDVSIIDDKSIVYGLTTTAKTRTQNSGFITNVKGDSGLLTITRNLGVVFNAKSSKLQITDNDGIIDTAKINYGITNIGYVNNVSIEGQTMAGGVIKNTITTSNKRIMIYDDNGSGSEIVVDANNIVTSTGFNTNGKFDLGKMLTEKAFNFDKIWTVIAPDNTTENQKRFKYGVPMLQIDLKPDLLQETMDKNFYWAYDDVTEVEFNNYVTSKYSTANITIETSDDLANVAKYSNYGVKTLKSEPSNRTIDIENYADSVVKNLISNHWELKTTEHVFGVVNTTTRKLLDYENKVLILPITENDSTKEVIMNFANKLWVPIGFGVDNVKDNNLVNGEGDNAKYLKPEFVGNHSYSNLFKGKITGNKYIIENVSAVGTNRNVGLFGAVQVSSNSIKEIPFASDILIRRSNFIAYSNNETGVTGTLAGFAYITANAHITNKVGIEETVIYGTNVASGLVGKIAFNQLSKLQINKTYVDSSVYASKTGTTSGLASVYCGGTSATDNAVVAEEVYFVGELLRKNKIDSGSRSQDSLFTGNKNTMAKSSSVYAVDYYDANAMSNELTSSNTCKQSITARNLGVKMLDGFDWISTWVRTMPGTYPTFSSKVEYWIKNIKRPDGSRIDTSAKIINIEPVTYTDSLGVERNTGPQELAWVAYVVNNGGREEFNGGIIDYNSFQNWTINIRGSLDFGGMVWTPIGYYISSGDNRAFLGNLVGLGDIRLSNIMTTGVYKLDNTSKTGVTSKSNSSLGLVGYAVGAIIDNLTIDSCVIYGAQNIGSFVGYAVNTEIVNCLNGSDAATEDKTYVGGYANIGGLVGTFEDKTGIRRDFSGNTNRAIVLYFSNYQGGNVAENFGGIAGRVAGNITMENNINKKPVEGYSNVGGLVGKIANGVTIDCAKDADADNIEFINGANYVGGIVGYIADGDCSVNAVYNSGRIKATLANGFAGGIAGYSAGTITLALNTGVVEADKSAGIVGKMDPNTAYIGNVLNKGTINGGFGIVNDPTSATRAAVGLSENNFGLCITTNGNPIGADKRNLAISYLGVFNVNAFSSLATNAFRYCGIDVSYSNIISQNPYWELSGSTVNLKHTVTKPASAIKPNIFTDEDSGLQYYSITRENHFNYVNWLIKTTFVNADIGGSEHKILKPIYFTSSTLELSSGFTALAENSAYPLRVDVTGPSIKGKIVVNGTQSSPQSIIGYVYGKDKEINISNLIVTNNNFSSSTNAAEATYTGTLIKIGDKVNIKNINILAADYYTSQYFGVIAGRVYNSKIENCLVNGSLKGTSSVRAGIVAEASNSQIKQCDNYAVIDSSGREDSRSIAGIVAIASDSTVVENCKNFANIKAGYDMGGIVGNLSSSTVKGCENTGEIRGIYSTWVNNNGVGGIVGYSYGATINENKNNGDVYGNNNNVGGIVGYIGSGSVDKNTHNSRVRGDKAVGGIVGYFDGGSVNNNTTDTKSVIANQSKDTSGRVHLPDKGIGGIVGYVNNGSVNNNTMKGFVGYADDSYVYLQRNLDNDAGYRTDNVANFCWATTTEFGISSIRSNKFKYGKIYGGYSSLSESDNTATTDARATQFVDQSTKYETGWWTVAIGSFSNGKAWVHNWSVQCENGTQEGYTLSQGPDTGYGEGGANRWGVGFNGAFVIYISNIQYADDDYVIFPGLEKVKVNFKEYSDKTTSLNPAYIEIVKDSTMPQIIPTKTDYLFTGWHYLDGRDFDYNAIISSEITIYATWTPANRVTLIFDSQGGSAVPNYVGKKGDNPTKPANPTKEGVSFVDWYISSYKGFYNGQYYDKTTETNKEVASLNKAQRSALWEGENGPKFDFSENIKTAGVIVLYAYWNKATIKFMNLDGTINTTQFVDWEGYADFVNAKNETDLAFQFWATKNADGNLIEYTANSNKTKFTDMVLEDLTLYPVYTSSRINVTFFNDDGSEYLAAQIAADSIPIKPANPEKTGYLFDAWYTTKMAAEIGDVTNKYKFDRNLTVDTSLYARFVKQDFTIKFLDSSGASLGIPDVTVKTADSVPRPATDPVKEGYDFDGWFTTPDLTTQFIFKGETNSDLIFENKQIYAKFTIKTFKVKFLKANGGLLKEVPVVWNTTVARPTELEDPEIEVNFRNWYIKPKTDELSNEDYDKFIFDFATKITDHKNIYGYWEPADKTYTVSFVDQAGNGIATQNPECVTRNVKFNKTFNETSPGAFAADFKPIDPADPENIFVGWFTREKRGSEDLTTYESEAKFNFDTPIRNDTFVYAYWKKPTKTVTVYDHTGDPYGIYTVEKFTESNTFFSSHTDLASIYGKSVYGYFTKSWDTYIHDGDFGSSGSPTLEDYVEQYGFYLIGSGACGGWDKITNDMSLYAYVKTT